MATYEVIVSPEFEAELQRLDRALQKRVKKILEDLPYRNWKKDALSGDLKGFYSHHFENNHYRLIYTIQNHVLKILAITVGKRTENFYKELKKYVNRKNIIPII